MIHRVAVVAVFACLVVSGCGTLPEHYIPQAVGPKDNAIVDAGLRLEIRAADDTTALGEPIRFLVTFANEGGQTFALPAEPEVLFFWTYPNGSKDNFLVDQPATRHYRSHEVKWLRPGEHLTRSVAVDTDYFERAGITEFRAMTRFAANTNPEFPRFWDGKAISNSYGILVAKDGDTRERMEASTLASVSR